MASQSQSDDEEPASREYSQAQEEVDEEMVRVLVSTDNHLGYCERDPVRGLDSFAAFEEVLYLAKQYKADMVLIAGDLFHDNKPSRRTLHKTMEIIRRYCMGPDPVHIQIISDQATNFRSAVHGAVNYEDENYSVDLPIFSIHGNHDDPAREGTELLAALDLLAVSNLVNYFGRQDEVDKVQVSPVMIQKGSTKVALYGMGSMRDERLNRMWTGKKVRFLRPAEEEEFFNIFALHQNRDLGRGVKNCVHESMIPEWMDLVVWGHEHECLIEPAESVVGTFRIMQPGSSVATSLTSGESARKHVGVLDIRGNQFRLRPVPLTQVRSFVMGDICLQAQENLDADDPKIDPKMTSVLEEEVRVLIHDAKDKRKELLEAAKAAGNLAQEDGKLKYTLDKPDEVLIRLKVEHTGFTTLNNQRFGARFVGSVANPDDVLLFHRRKAAPKPRAKTKKGPLSDPVPPEEMEEMQVEELIGDFLVDSDKQLKIFTEDKLGVALDDYVTKEQAKALSDAFERGLRKVQKEIMSTKKDVEEEDDDGEDEPASAAAANRERVEQESQATSTKKRQKRQVDDSEEDENEPPPKQRSRKTTKSTAKKKGRRYSTDSDEDDDAMEVSQTSKAAAASKKKTAARSQRTAGRSRVNYSMEDGDDDDESDAVVVLDDEDEEEDLPPPKKKRAAARTSRKAPAKKKATKRSRRQASDDESDYSVDEHWESARTTTQR